MPTLNKCILPHESNIREMKKGFEKLTCNLNKEAICCHGDWTYSKKTSSKKVIFSPQDKYFLIHLQPVLPKWLVHLETC